MCCVHGDRVCVASMGVGHVLCVYMCMYVVCTNMSQSQGVCMCVCACVATQCSHERYVAYAGVCVSVCRVRKSQRRSTSSHSLAKVSCVCVWPRCRVCVCTRCRVCVHFVCSADSDTTITSTGMATIICITPPPHRNEGSEEDENDQVAPIGYACVERAGRQAARFATDSSLSLSLSLSLFLLRVSGSFLV